MQLKSNGDDSMLLDSLVIRHVQKNDLPSLEWDGEYRHFRRVFADAYERYRTGLSILWVADLPAPGPGIIGQVFIQLNCDRPELADGIERAYLYSFRVRTSFRGKGIGTRILDVVESDLKERGYHYITLNVARVNISAQRLYSRHGYKVIAPEPGKWSYPDEYGIWHHVEEPAWRMQKRLF
jgi:ribosomal protein S18 acetylase RimI-like enzyme